MYSLLGRLSGQTLKYLRSERSVAEVAARAGVSATVWQLWEDGEQLPPPQNTSAVLGGLGCSVAEYELAFLVTAQTVRECRRTNALRATGVPELEELADGLKAALFGNLVIYDVLERISSSMELCQRVKLTSVKAPDDASPDDTAPEDVA